MFGLPLDGWKRLQGKSYWITGAGTGYGRCLAVALAAAGGQVILTGRRRQKLEETLEEMTELSIPTSECHLIPCDITDLNEVRAACAKVSTLSESLYGLVNNAAIAATGKQFPLQEDGLEDWDRIIRTNLTAHWLVTRAIIPHMMKGHAVRVLFMTSEAGWAATPGFGPYNIVKAALNSLTMSMAAEYASRFPRLDLQINALIPGEAQTEMNQGSRESPYSVVSMALALLSHSDAGPNGRFFHRDGRHFKFAYSERYDKRLI